MHIKAILTDIEGTTTSVSFVYDVLFPYFRNNIYQLLDLKENVDVKKAFEEVRQISISEGQNTPQTEQEIINILLKWSLEDRKITPLKTLQGILWKSAYENGKIKGHIYDDVAPALQYFKEKNIILAVYSSGSIEAQRLIFKYSVAGDLTPFFTAYFDTKTGGKREETSYKKIADGLRFQPSQILFLSDIKEELEAAQNVGYKTIQLLREDKLQEWENTIKSFTELENFIEKL